jgi:dTDP-4-dehydro-6-deoxy-alpha-D-glucopyranose 2,3-dehydratase
MKTYEEIVKILEKEGYKITDDSKMRINQFLECLNDDNEFHNLEYVLKWLEEKRKKCTMEMKEVPINELNKWKVDTKTGNISHESGEFFSIIGVRTSNTSMREVNGWDQPFIYQKEGGILGILRKQINGVMYYLLHAKAEPGNPCKLQLSPTLQATFSNLKKAHEGKKPKFSEYFENPKEGTLIYSKWYAEDGGRLYLKSNKNMLVETNDEIVVPEDYIWLTMYQIKHLLKYDNLINPHVRGIISYL